MKLITRLVQPSDGCILINDTDLLTFNMKFLKKKILYISQDEYIINENIADYAKYMGIDVTMAHLNDFLDIWNFHENEQGNISEIRLENNAGNISGGQKKKLLALKLFSKCKNRILAQNEVTGLFR